MSDDKQDPKTDNKSDNKAGVGKNILEKIMTVIKEDSRALSEAVMDSRGTRIHERQIEVARDSIKQAKRAITDELAKELQSSRKLKIINERVDQQEQRIIDALSQDDEALAFELATEMVELEQDRDTEAAILRSHELHLGHLTRQMEQTERNFEGIGTATGDGANHSGHPKGDRCDHPEFCQGRCQDVVSQAIPGTDSPQATTN